MEDSSLVCWKCGFDLSGMHLPISREARCKNCFSDLHVCRLCEFYNAKISDHCDAEVTDVPREPDRANFCDYFKPKTHAFVETSKSDSELAKQKLEELFGKSTSSDGSVSTGGESNVSKQKLEELFGINKGKSD